MIAFLFLVIGVGVGCVIGRGTAPHAPEAPVVIFEDADFRAEYIERHGDMS